MSNFDKSPPKGIPSSWTVGSGPFSMKTVCWELLEVRPPSEMADQFSFGHGLSQIHSGLLTETVDQLSPWDCLDQRDLALPYTTLVCTTPAVAYCYCYSAVAISAAS